ncbi:type II CAAX endopeptidase family protein [Enterococcus devriesei]|uniref:CPBP family intramembrane glutamic endopeptidase n=1 Tax=Enterococcus TaxID=1350 RepID=UPI001C105869|nr:type II CAAX endopeptidase family protein [Enterococcus devriesei]MBU5364082.1 CPBP family intramembrane metalloprotease [Enterococcus devriesei]MDT2820680.1 type II CAAX endopeptidase family protein [Enterococcus devriesei]
MNAKKYSFITIFTYGLVLFSPVIFLQVFRANPSQIIQLTTLTYFLGAALMIFYRYKSQLFGIESQQKKVLIAILIGIIGIPASLLLQMLILQIEQRFLGQSATSQNTQNIVDLIMNNMVFIFATTIAGPIMEEFVFRRAIFGSLEKRFGFLIPALLSSLLFAFAHNDGHYLLYAGLGFLFCGMYRYSGRIWTSMITHVGMNLLVILTQLAVHSDKLIQH